MSELKMFSSSIGNDLLKSIKDNDVVHRIMLRGPGGYLENEFGATDGVGVETISDTDFTIILNDDEGNEVSSAFRIRLVDGELYLTSVTNVDWEEGGIVFGDKDQYEVAAAEAYKAGISNLDVEEKVKEGEPARIKTTKGEEVLELLSFWAKQSRYPTLRKAARTLINNQISELRETIKKTRENINPDNEKESLKLIKDTQAKLLALISRYKKTGLDGKVDPAELSKKEDDRTDVFQSSIDSVFESYDYMTSFNSNNKDHNLREFREKTHLINVLDHILEVGKTRGVIKDDGTIDLASLKKIYKDGVITSNRTGASAYKVNSHNEFISGVRDGYWNQDDENMFESLQQFVRDNGGSVTMEDIREYKTQLNNEREYPLMQAIEGLEDLFQVVRESAIDEESMKELNKKYQATLRTYARAMIVDFEEAGVAELLIAIDSHIKSSLVNGEKANAFDSDERKQFMSLVKSYRALSDSKDVKPSVKEDLFKSVILNTLAYEGSNPPTDAKDRLIPAPQTLMDSTDITVDIDGDIITIYTATELKPSEDEPANGGYRYGAVRIEYDATEDLVRLISLDDYLLDTISELEDMWEHHGSVREFKVNDSTMSTNTYNVFSILLALSRSNDSSLRSKSKAMIKALFEKIDTGNTELRDTILSLVDKEDDEIYQLVSESFKKSFEELIPLEDYDLAVDLDPRAKSITLIQDILKKSNAYNLADTSAKRASALTEIVKILNETDNPLIVDLRSKFLKTGEEFDVNNPEKVGLFLQQLSTQSKFVVKAILEDMTGLLKTILDNSDNNSLKNDAREIFATSLRALVSNLSIGTSDREIDTLVRELTNATYLSDSSKYVTKVNDTIGNFLKESNLVKFDGIVEEEVKIVEEKDKLSSAIQQLVGAAGLANDLEITIVNGFLLQMARGEELLPSQAQELKAILIKHSLLPPYFNYESALKDYQEEIEATRPELGDKPIVSRFALDYLNDAFENTDAGRTISMRNVLSFVDQFNEKINNFAHKDRITPDQRKETFSLTADQLKQLKAYKQSGNSSRLPSFVMEKLNEIANKFGILDLVDSLEANGVSDNSPELALVLEEIIRSFPGNSASRPDLIDDFQMSEFIGIFDKQLKAGKGTVAEAFVEYIDKLEADFQLDSDEHARLRDLTGFLTSSRDRTKFDEAMIELDPQAADYQDQLLSLAKLIRQSYVKDIETNGRSNMKVEKSMLVKDFNGEVAYSHNYGVNELDVEKLFVGVEIIQDDEKGTTLTNYADLYKLINNLYPHEIEGSYENFVNFIAANGRITKNADGNYVFTTKFRDELVTRINHFFDNYYEQLINGEKQASREQYQVFRSMFEAIKATIGHDNIIDYETAKPGVISVEDIANSLDLLIRYSSQFYDSIDKKSAAASAPSATTSIDQPDTISISSISPNSYTMNLSKVDELDSTLRAAA